MNEYDSINARIEAAQTFQELADLIQELGWTFREATNNSFAVNDIMVVNDGERDWMGVNCGDKVKALRMALILARISNQTQCPADGQGCDLMQAYVKNNFPVVMLSGVHHPLCRMCAEKLREQKGDAE